MCTDSRETLVDLETVAREFHEIKHILSDLNGTVTEIARSLRTVEAQLAKQK
jgi:hypothetical protein